MNAKDLPLLVIDSLHARIFLEVTIAASVQMATILLLEMVNPLVTQCATHRAKMVETALVPIDATAPLP